MIYEKLVNTDKEADVKFDICIPCWENSTKLDETISNILESDFKVKEPVKFIISVEKQSVVKNRLDCLTRSKSPYVLWLDDDIKFVDVGWDYHLHQCITGNPKWGIVGVNVVHYKALDNRPTRPGGPIADVCGAVMMTRKIPGVQFDPNYIGSQWEDTDYCYQVRKAGYDVIQNNNLYVLHYNEEKNRDYTHNQAYFTSKWLTPR